MAKYRHQGSMRIDRYKKEPEYGWAWAIGGLIVFIPVCAAAG